MKIPNYVWWLAGAAGVYYFSRPARAAAPLPAPKAPSAPPMPRLPSGMAPVPGVVTPGAPLDFDAAMTAFLNQKKPLPPFNFSQIDPSAVAGSPSAVAGSFFYSNGPCPSGYDLVNIGTRSQGCRKRA